MKQLNQSSRTAVVLALISLMSIVFCGAVFAYSNRNGQSTTRQTYNLPTTISRSQASLINQSTSEQLQYLIEEEKLAHDVYTALNNLYGVRVFSNIASSEQTHQDKVLALLNQLGISDPRLNEPGKFVNQNLQALYDSLMLKGTKSIQDAYQVGITIEQIDITDLNNQLNNTTDSKITATLSALLTGSQNHLRAFSRQA